MYARLVFLLFLSQTILNGSSADTIESYRLVTSRSEIPQRTPIVAVPLDYVTFAEDHAAYKIHTEPKTWDEAREECKLEHAHLAIADTSDKIAHIKSLENNSATKWIHVGIYYSNTTNGWVRVDNDLSVTSLPWSSMEDNPTEGCAGIPLSEEKLVTYPCDWMREYFACEISL